MTGKTGRAILYTIVCLASGLIWAQAAQQPAKAQAGQQKPQQQSVLHLGDCQGEAPIAQFNGRSYIDLEALAQISSGTLSFQGNRILLAPAPCATTTAGSSANAQTAKDLFSREFTRAAIEAITTMREWGSTLATIVQNGYPMPANGMAPYPARAQSDVRMAGAAVSTDADREGMQLLTNEFNRMQAWSTDLVNARNTMNAANLSLTPNALSDDPTFQRLVQCGQFLGSMLSSGKFQDDPSCH